MWFWISEIICTSKRLVVFSFMEIEDNVELYVTQDILQLSILQQTYGKAVP